MPRHKRYERPVAPSIPKVDVLIWYEPGETPQRALIAISVNNLPHSKELVASVDDSKGRPSVKVVEK